MEKKTEIWMQRKDLLLKLSFHASSKNQWVIIQTEALNNKKQGAQKIMGMEIYLSPELEDNANLLSTC